MSQMARPIAHSPVTVDGRTALLNWVAEVTGTRLQKVEDAANGVTYLNLVNAYFPGSVPMSKVVTNAVTEYDIMKNYKVLTTVFLKLNIEKNIDVDKLMKGRAMDNLDMLQWLKAYFDAGHGRVGGRPASASSSRPPSSQRERAMSASSGGRATSPRAVDVERKPPISNSGISNAEVLAAAAAAATAAAATAQSQSQGGVRRTSTAAVLSSSEASVGRQHRASASLPSAEAADSLAAAAAAAMSAVGLDAGAPPPLPPATLSRSASAVGSRSAASGGAAVAVADASRKNDVALQEALAALAEQKAKTAALEAEVAKLNAKLSSITGDHDYYRDKMRNALVLCEVLRNYEAARFVSCLERLLNGEATVTELANELARGEAEKGRLR
eukprot:jgi/Mesvir1/21804/Mv04195-RA.1